MITACDIDVMTNISNITDDFPDADQNDYDKADVVLQRVNIQRVFPSLCKECTNNNMVPFLLPSMMLIAEQASDADFSKHIFPAFIPLFPITDPVQVQYPDSFYKAFNLYESVQQSL